MTTLVDFGIREQAAQRFEQLGWPTPRLEEWKYTNLAPVQRETWKRATRTGEGACPPLENHRLRMAAAEYVFINGLYAPDCSTPHRDLALSDELRAGHYARYADYENHAMTALNTANAQDGAMLHIGPHFDGFVHLLFVSTDGYESYPRNLIVVGRGAQATIVETYTGAGRSFTNAVTEIVALDGAVVDHTKFECESIDAFHVGLVHIHQERSSSVTSHSIAIG